MLYRSDGAVFEVIRLRRSLESDTFKAPPAEKSPLTSKESAPQYTNTPSPSGYFPPHPLLSLPEHQPQPSSHSNPTEQQHKMAQLFTYAFQGPTHYEAYILRPQVHSTNDSSTLSYTAELLHLDGSGLESYVAKLGPDYSILNTVGELLPAQLRIIQERAHARGGNLVSVQYGAEVDLVTQLGTFKVKSVMFVMKITADKEKEIGVKEVPVQKAWIPPVSGDSATNLTGKGLFGDMPLIQPPVVEPYGARTSLPPRAFVDHCSATAFYAEKDYSDPRKVQEYMSITFTDEHSDKSFEELRLADYKSGHTSMSNKLTSLVDQSGPVPKPAFEAPSVFQSNQARGSYGATKGPAPFPFFGGSAGVFGSAKAPSSNSAIAPPVPADLFGGLSAGFGATYAPSTTAVDFPAVQACPPESVLKAGPAPDAAAKNPFMKLVLPPVSSNPPSPRSEKCRECSKSFEPYADSKVCDECVKKANCWLCEPKIKAGVVAVKADEQKETVHPAEADSKDDPQTPDSQDKLETSLSALIIVPDAEAAIASKTEKQNAKEKDFDCGHETEDIWSARYDRSEARRIEDAKKPPKESTHFYAVDETDVAWEQQAEWAKSVRSANWSPGSTAFPEFGAGDTNKTSGTTPSNDDSVDSGTVPAAGGSTFTGLTPNSSIFGTTSSEDNSAGNEAAPATGGGLFGSRAPNSNMFDTASRADKPPDGASSLFGGFFGGFGDKGKDKDQKGKDKEQMEKDQD
jgi:hypothetical protein